MECRNSPPLVYVHGGIVRKESIFATITGIICKINIMINRIQAKVLLKSLFGMFFEEM
jgi:hypothetical protein